MPKYALTPVEYDEISFVHAGANPDADIVLAKSSSGVSAEELYKAFIPEAEREAAKKKGLAFSDNSYPIRNQQDAEDAWKLRGRSKNHSSESVESHVRSACNKLGLKMPGENGVTKFNRSHIQTGVNGGRFTSPAAAANYSRPKDRSNSDITDKHKEDLDDDTAALQARKLRNKTRDEDRARSRNARADKTAAEKRSLRLKRRESIGKNCPDPGDVHMDGPMKMAGKKKKLTKAEALKAVADKGGSTEASVYKTQANVYGSVLDLGSDILSVIYNGGSRTDIAKLLQDHADLVSHDVDEWLDPEVSKSVDYDSETLETLRDSREILNTVLAKAGSRGDVMPITDEERAGLPDTVRKYLETLESVTKDLDEEEVDDETIEEIDDIEVDVEFDDEEEDENEKVLASVGKAGKTRKPKVKRMRLVSGNKRSSGNKTSSGSKKFSGPGGSGFSGFGKSAKTDEILKSIADPTAQAIVKSLMDSQRDLLEEIEKGKEEKEVARWVETAKAWTHLPGKPEDIGAQLRAVEKSLGEEAAKNLAAQMEAAQTMAKQSNVFKSAGVGGGEGSDTKNKIEKAVEAEIEKFKADGVSAEVAKAKAQVSVFEAHPEYYDEYVATKGVK